MSWRGGLEQKRYSVGQIECVIEYFENEYLLCLPLKQRVEKNTPEGLRFLWHYHSALALGWREQYVEGHPQGFFDKIYIFIWTMLWPSIESNGKEQVSGRNRLSLCAKDRQLKGSRKPLKLTNNVLL